jgi:hypothetical protein
MNVNCKAEFALDKLLRSDCKNAAALPLLGISACLLPRDFAAGGIGGFGPGGNGGPGCGGNGGLSSVGVVIYATVHLLREISHRQGPQG